MNTLELQATCRVSVGAGVSGSAIDSLPRAAERTAITTAGADAESFAARTPDEVTGQAAVSDGREQPVGRERHDDGGGVDVCEGVFEGVVDEVGDGVGGGRQAASESAPVALLSDPAGQGVTFTDATGQYDPTVQLEHADESLAPTLLLNVPARQGTGVLLPRAQ